MKKRNILKAIALCLSLLLAIGCLTGCEGNNLKETKQLKIYNPASTKTIVGTRSGFFELINYLYPKTHPDVELDYRVSEMSDDILYYGSGITDETASQLQAYYDSVSSTLIKQEDIIFVDTYYQWFDDVTPPDYRKMIDDGQFADLKPLLAKVAPNLDLSAYDDLLIDGKLYAIPIYNQPYVLFSAENMLAERGFDYNAKDDILTYLNKCVAWQEEHASDADAPVVFTKQAWDFVSDNLYNIIGVEDENDPQVIKARELLDSLKSDLEEPLWDDVPGDDLDILYNRALFGRAGGTYDSMIMASYQSKYLWDNAVLVPLLQADGKAATSAGAYIMIPKDADNKLNAVRYIAMSLESVVDDQKGEAKFPLSLGHHYLFAWDAGEEGLEARLANKLLLQYMSEDTADTIRYLYQNQGKLCMPPYWYESGK